MYILDAYVSEDLALFLGKTLNLIHIAAPILLIVFVTIDLIKAILSQDNEIVSKTVRSIKNRTIACIMIFFLPTIVEVIFTQASVTLNLDKKEYEDILSTYKSVINSENIKEGKQNQSFPSYYFINPVLYQANLPDKVPQQHQQLLFHTPCNVRRTDGYLHRLK